MCFYLAHLLKTLFIISFDINSLWYDSDTSFVKAKVIFDLV